MPRGGKRLGAGRKPTRRRYKRRESIGKRAFEIGQRCEELWQAQYKTNFIGFHETSEKRPRAWKRIIAQVAEEFGLPYGVVERLKKDFRQLKADLKADVKNYQPDTNNCHLDDTV